VEPRRVVLRRYPARIHAELAKSALDANELDSIIGGVEVNYEHATPSQTIELIVREEDVERALEILGPEEEYSN
jgi:hypothetical protein